MVRLETAKYTLPAPLFATQNYHVKPYPPRWNASNLKDCLALDGAVVVTLSHVRTKRPPAQFPPPYRE